MNKELDQDELLTAGEAAKFLGINPDQLRYLRKQGRVKPALRFGYETFYRVPDLRNADLKKRKRGPKNTGTEKA